MMALAWLSVLPIVHAEYNAALPAEGGADDDRCSADGTVVSVGGMEDELRRMDSTW
jgi:hypothetical protein